MGWDQPWKRFGSHVEMLKVQSRTVQVLCEVAREGNAAERRGKVQFLKLIQSALACFATVVLGSQQYGNL